ncbi:hypothetical protein [Cryobacterium sp. HLT2-28]|uniref:hypothetical protein n=1 Tax=Cryobacterium sp. HLT2-28 TaxID=1259146 RepID=UPI00106B95D3|nr:hypothetical protein [Cryobacterium sp. HLT2-28]TFB92778.1 hypothetical protein E3O48_13530 [Cryobacterium sp. HLT2-28]
MTNATDTNSNLRTLAEQHMASIRNNRDLSNEAKLRQLARAYLDLKDGLNGLETGLDKTAADRRAVLERRLFGIPNTADANSMISYRDALDRASQIQTRDETTALAMLNKARTAGDDLLVRAVLATAFEREWVDVINEFAAKNPALDKDVTELWTIQQKGEDVFAQFAFIAVKPKELSSYSDSALRVMAAGETPSSKIAVF